MSAKRAHHRTAEDKGCPLCSSIEAVRTVRQTAHFSFKRCTECDFWFVPESITSDYSGDDAVTQTYYKYAHNQQFSSRFDEYRNLFVESLRRRLALFSSSWGASDRRAFLDVGCGSGLYVDAANRLELEGYGIEVDASAAEFGQGRGLNIATSTFEAVDLPTSHFTFIQFKQTLEHMPNVTQTLRLAHQLLRPGGHLIIDVPNMYGFIPRPRCGFLFVESRLVPYNHLATPSPSPERASAWPSKTPGLK